MQGMVCFCDAEVAEEYRKFLARFHEENPDANHYDDYFVGFFKKATINFRRISEKAAIL